MFQNYTLNSIVMMLLGVGLIGWGAYNGWEYRRSITSMFVFPTVVGFILSGLAAIVWVILTVLPTIRQEEEC